MSKGQITAGAAEGEVSHGLLLPLCTCPRALADREREGAAAAAARVSREAHLPGVQLVVRLIKCPERWKFDTAMQRSYTFTLVRETFSLFDIDNDSKYPGSIYLVWTVYR